MRCSAPLPIVAVTATTKPPSTTITMPMPFSGRRQDGSIDQQRYSEVGDGHQSNDNYNYCGEEDDDNDDDDDVKDSNGTVELWSDNVTEFLRPSTNSYSDNVVTTNPNTNSTVKNSIATRKARTTETTVDDSDDDSENGMQFNYEDDEDFYCNDDEDNRQLVQQQQKQQKQGRKTRRPFYVEEEEDDNNNSGDDYHLQSNFLSTLLSKQMYQYLYPPNVPKTIQLYRWENLAIPACYLLVGVLQGLSGPFTNVYPLDLNASEAQQVSSMPCSTSDRKRSFSLEFLCR